MYEFFNWTNLFILIKLFNNAGRIKKKVFKITVRRHKHMYIIILLYFTIIVPIYCHQNTFF